MRALSKFCFEIQLSEHYIEELKQWHNTHAAGNRDKMLIEERDIMDRNSDGFVDLAEILEDDVHKVRAVQARPRLEKHPPGFPIFYCEERITVLST